MAIIAALYLDVLVFFAFQIACALGALHDPFLERPTLNNSIGLCPISNKVRIPHLYRGSNRLHRGGLVRARPSGFGIFLLFLLLLGTG